MNTADIAKQLETTPRTLRRFLRADTTYRNAGSGGRYDFQESDLPTLTKRFNAWHTKSSGPTANGTGVAPTPRVTRRVEQSDDTIHPYLALSRNPRMRAEILAAAREREIRLLNLMKEAGIPVGMSRKQNAEAS